MENTVDLKGRTAPEDGGDSDRSKSKRQPLPKRESEQLLQNSKQRLKNSEQRMKKTMQRLQNSTQRLQKSKQLLQDNEHLRARLEDANAALEAIRSGGVDALVVSSDEGDRVFTLQGAEHPYRVMVETMNEGAATLLEDGIILYANPRLAAILSEPLETLIGSSILDFIASEDSQVFDGLVEQGFDSPSRAEIRIHCRDQSFVPVLISLSPTQVEGARALCLVVTDLTEQKRNEEIVAAERLARSILEQAGEAILVCDNAGRIIRANQKALQLFPRNPIYKKFEAALPLVFINPEGESNTFSITNVLDGVSFQEIEAEYPTQYPPGGGEKRFFLLSAAPLLKGQDQIIGCIVTLTEMTEWKRAEAALQASEERLVDFLESTNDSFFALDRAWRIIYANERYCKITGKDAKEIVGKNFWEVFPRYAGTPVERAYRKAMEERTPVQFQSSGFYSKNRYDLAVYPTQDGISAFATDRTDEHKAVEALRESEHRFRIMADDTLVIIWVTNAAGETEFINRAYCEFFGVTMEQVQSEGWQPLVHPDDFEGYVGYFTQCLQDQRPFRAQARQRRHDGEWRWIDSQSQPRVSESGEFLGMAGSSLDVTDRMQAERALRESEQKFRMLFENSPDAVFLMKPIGYIAAANPAACAMLGRSEQEFCGMRREEVLDANDPRLAVTLEERRQTGRIQAHELYAIRKNGERFPVEVDSVILPDDPALTFVIMRDITRRKQAEETLRQSEAMLREYAEKLERSNQELQDFAFIASHDLQEPLRKIEGFSSQIGMGSNLSDTDQEFLRRVQDATRRMRKMIDDLLELSRVTTSKKPYKRVDLNEVAKTVLDDFEPRIRKSQGQIVLHPLPVIEADAMQMHQLLQNLVGNAVKYSKKDTPPFIQVGSRASSAGWVEITVQDNGIGFDMVYKDQIFQPFKRLHGRSAYEGSGIGLSICQKIVERHRGRITAQSAPGEGSTFIVVLPMKQSTGDDFFVTNLECDA